MMKTFWERYLLFLLLYVFFGVWIYLNPGNEPWWFIIGGAIIISCGSSVIYTILKRGK
jgi:drug/metabolite transporter (DMT)-like permease